MIRLLDDVTINQIAAGEVIERPASVVKELLENAIDAGATRVEIETRAGGRHMIRVTDNGSGMDRDDALMALERHATSKVTRVEDLTDLSTLGFRGEALASIAAVSHLKLVTATDGQVAGTTIEAEGGVIKRVQDAGAAKGTTIIVSDLFFNVPPRLKYLKAIPTEASYIADITGRLALARPDVAFRLNHGDFEVLFTPGTGDPSEAISAVLGRELAKDLIPVEERQGVVYVHGVIGRPENAKSNRQSQYFYVNGRPVKSHLVAAALEKAYHTLLPIARFPLAVLFVELPGTEVDVNVHPAKTEVRFHSEGEVFRTVFAAVSQALRQCSLLPSWVGGEGQTPEIPMSAGGSGKAVPVQGALSYGPNDASPVAREETAVALAADPTAVHPCGHPAPVCLDGLLDDTYILASDGNGLVIIDQHAAHERVLYEELMRTPDGQADSQSLALSQTLDLNYRQYRVVADHISAFEGLGYCVEPFGGKSVVIRAVPVIHGIHDYAELLVDLVEQFLAMETFRNPRELREAFFTTMACRAAVKAGDRTSFLERQALVERLWQTQNPYTCPHGRPTMIRLSRDEMDRRFRRR